MNTGILGNILTDNIPYTEKNPFTVSFTDATLARFAVAMLLVLAVVIGGAYAFRKINK